MYKVKSIRNEYGIFSGDELVSLDLVFKNKGIAKRVCHEMNKNINESDITNKKISVNKVSSGYSVFLGSDLYDGNIKLNSKLNAKLIADILNLDMDNKEYKTNTETVNLQLIINSLCEEIKEYKLKMHDISSILKIEDEDIHEKIELLNELQVIETDYDGDTIIYCLVENTKENMELLHKIGFTDDEILDSCAFSDLEELSKSDTIDIAMLAFKYADIYYKDRFILFEDIKDYI